MISWCYARWNRGFTTQDRDVFSLGTRKRRFGTAFHKCQWFGNFFMLQTTCVLTQGLSRIPSVCWLFIFKVTEPNSGVQLLDNCAFDTKMSQFVTNVTTPRDFRYLVDPDSRLDSGLERPSGWASSLNSPSSGVGLFYADSGFFDGKNRVLWRIGSKPFL